MMSYNIGNGLNGHTMVRSRSADSSTEAKSRRSRPALERFAQRPQRNSLDTEDGRTVARSSRSVSAIPDVPSAIPTMGAVRGAEKDHRKARARSARPWRNRPEGMLRRRHFCSGEKGGACVGKTKRGKGTKVMAIADRNGVPIAVCIESASPHEVTLVDTLLSSRFLRALPKRLIGDMAYDSDGLDEKLARRRIEMISPHRSNRKRRATQDGRPMRRYKRRWKVERVFSWLQNNRRVLVRQDFHAENYLGFVLLSCITIVLKRLL
jgi:transposase